MIVIYIHSGVSGELHHEMFCGIERQTSASRDGWSKGNTIEQIEPGKVEPEGEEPRKGNFFHMRTSGSGDFSRSATVSVSKQESFSP